MQCCCWLCDGECHEVALCSFSSSCWDWFYNIIDPNPGPCNEFSLNGFEVWEVFSHWTGKGRILLPESFLKAAGQQWSLTTATALGYPGFCCNYLTSPSLWGEGWSCVIVHCLCNLHITLTKWFAFTEPVLHTGKLGHREIKWLAQGYITRQWQSWVYKPGPHSFPGYFSVPFLNASSYGASSTSFGR